MDTTIAKAEPDVELPDDMIDAWASVLIDLYEKHRQSPANESTSTTEKESDKMPRYLTTEADLNFPVPNAQRVAAQVRALSDGTQPVTTAVVARSLGVGTAAIEAVLRRAERNGLVQCVQGQGWLSIES